MIEFSRVGFDYGDRTILSDVSLSIPEGSFHFVTGPSGAGKTTFLRLCYLALRPTSGTVTLFGRDAAGVDRDEAARLRRRIGIVFQDGQFLDHLSLADNVALPLRIQGKPQAQRREQVQELLDWVGLAHRADARPAELSAGERQRASLARAVIGGPDFVIADEPTGNVDREMGRRILGLLTALNGHGTGVLMATHDLDLIRAAKSEVAARVLRIADRSVTTAGAVL
ncbi:cell division ATP-binding protein FtsE [Rhodovulum sp. DZ06]|uniref:cell division ATP-binding protein FtsE n=1 Tax=Rhodovulum sp. DZ06 TaxID=3425126 RepID=UPI003D34C4A5